jgi:hypothetical protein
MLAEIASPHVTTSDPAPATKATADAVSGFRPEDFVSLHLEIRTERPVYNQPEIAVALGLLTRIPRHEMMLPMATAPSD